MSTSAWRGSGISSIPTSDSENSRISSGQCMVLSTRTGSSSPASSPSVPVPGRSTKRSTAMCSLSRIVTRHRATFPDSFMAEDSRA